MSNSYHEEERKYTDFSLIKDLFTTQTARFSHRTALYERQGNDIRQISFAELRRAVFSMGGWLWSQGWHNKHIAIVSKNSYPYIVLLWAILCGDNTGVLIDCQLNKEELLRRLDQTDTDVVFCDAENAPLLAGCGRPVITMETLINEQFLHEGAECTDFEAYKPNGDDLALMLFSSGTTGQSKAVMFSQQAFSEGARSHIIETITPRSEFFLPIPLFHIMALISQFVHHIGVGSGMFIHTDSRRFFADIAYIKPYGIQMVPVQIEVLHAILQVNGVEATRELLGGNLKVIATGGAAVKAEVVDSLKRLGIFIVSGYGMTEIMIVAPVKVMSPPETHMPPPTPPVEPSARSSKIRIDNPDAAGNGEIQVLNNHMFSGYYKDPEATAAAFTEDGWFRTGDIGHVDDDGFIYITGRKKNLIILGSGENVIPETLEELFLRSPLVAECQVFEIDDAIGVEIFPADDAFPESTPQDEMTGQLKALVKSINADQPSSHYISKAFLRSSPFEKTSIGKIRRNIRPLMEKQLI